MNSSKRGAVYGFKLQSLDLVRPHKVQNQSQVRMKTKTGLGSSDLCCNSFHLTLINWRKLGPRPGLNCVFMSQLLETKSTDRTQTLLHYIANVVREKYLWVAMFYNELHYVDKAAAGNQQNAGNKKSPIREQGEKNQDLVGFT